MNSRIVYELLRRVNCSRRLVGNSLFFLLSAFFKKYFPQDFLLLFVVVVIFHVVVGGLVESKVVVVVAVWVLVADSPLLLAHHLARRTLSSSNSYRRCQEKHSLMETADYRNLGLLCLVYIGWGLSQLDLLLLLRRVLRLSFVLRIFDFLRG